MFLPLLGLISLMAMDLAKENLSENVVGPLTSLVIVLGVSLIVLLGLFLLLMNREVRKWAFKFLGIKASLTYNTAPTIYAVPPYILQHPDGRSDDKEALFGWTQ